MSWGRLVKPPLREVGPYEPGASFDELMARYELTEIAKLNWNEGLWGPLPGVADAVTAALGEVWAYPEHAYNALREGIAADTGACPRPSCASTSSGSPTPLGARARASPGSAIRTTRPAR